MGARDRSGCGGALHLPTMFPRVRGRRDTFGGTPLVPWSPWVSGKLGLLFRNVGDAFCGKPWVPGVGWVAGDPGLLFKSVEDVVGARPAQTILHCLLQRQES